MKNAAIILLLIIAIALGALAFHQKTQAGRVQSELAQTQTELSQAQAQLKASTEAAQKISSAEMKTKILQDTLAETSKFANEKSKQADELKQSLATAKTNNANPFAEMFKDPKMKEMIKAQQKAMFGPMIEKQYAALFQQLNLTPEQSTQLKDLLKNKMMVGADAGMSMMDDSLTKEQRADLGKQIKTQTDDYDAQIKTFLGDDNYKAYEAYEKTTPDRMTVSQFSDQLETGTAMTPDQQSQLIQAMSDARNNFKWTTDYSKNDPPNGDMAAMFTDDKLAKFTQEKEQFDQQFADRAKQILSEPQFAAFQQFQTQQRDMQIAGMKMAAKMFGTKSQ